MLQSSSEAHPTWRAESLRMKNRLTRKLLLIVAIPVTFELALFSTCAVMLNIAEIESANESRTIRVMARMAPVLVSSVSSVTLTARALLRKQAVDPAHRSAERLAVQHEIDSFLKVATDSEFAEYQRQIRAICDAAEKLGDCLDQVTSTITNRTESVRALFDLRDAVSTIDQTSQIILNDLKRNRRELAESDAVVRRAFHFILWSSLAMSFCVAITGLIAFEKLLSKPLKELIKLSNGLADGIPVTAMEPMQHANDEIGDLGRAFESMAAELERRTGTERAIFENSADIICTIDKENRIQIINNAAKTHLGFEPRRLVDCEISELLPEKQKSNVLNRLEEIREKETYGSFESTLLKENGIEFDVVWSVRWSSQDDLLYCCLYNIDFERKTERFAKNLRTIVVIELTQALKEAKSSVLKLKSSEIKTTQKLDLLDSNFLKIVNLLKTLGDAISKESTDIPLSTKPTEVARLLKESLESVSFLAKQKSVNIIVSTRSVDSIVMDPAQIQRVVVNLLSNAIKASPHGGEIKVLARLDGQFIHFEIADQGPGIPLNKQHMLFERFNQVGKLQSEEGKGSGLGLYSARQIVEAHGGTIGVISDGQNGCTFRVTLPARQQ